MTAFVLSALLCAAVPRPAPAPPETSATILRIDGRDAYFDLGRVDGASTGAKVTVYRRVSVLNPRTGAPMQDRFLVTEIEIAEASDRLSRARLEPEVAGSVRIGDLVQLTNPPRLPPVAVQAPPLPRGSTVAVPAPVDAAPAKTGQTVGVPLPQMSPATSASLEPDPEQREALAIREAFVRAGRLSPDLRAGFWERWAADHPGSPAAEPAKRMAEAMRGTHPEPIAAAPPPEPPPPPIPTVTAPSQAVADDKVELVLTWPGEAPEAAQFNYRPIGSALYQTVHLVSDGGRTQRGTLPPEAVQPPGIEWWAGAIENGAERPVAGTGDRPKALEVLPVPGFDQPLRKDRSRAGLWVDYADWNRFKGNDWYVDLEAEFLYRVLSAGLHSIRMGFGVYQGKGQSLQSAIEDERANRPYSAQPVGYQYGFTELEFHPAPMLGIIGKLLTGVNREGFGAGFEGRLRIGYENGTNLVIASGLTKGIGNKNEIALSWDRVKGWPMVAAVVVTNEPTNADYGVRFLYTIGRSLTDHADISVRLSYQLRDINHNGFGVGLAESFHW